MSNTIAQNQLLINAVRNVHQEVSKVNVQSAPEELQPLRSSLENMFNAFLQLDGETGKSYSYRAMQEVVDMQDSEGSNKLIIKEAMKCHGWEAWADKFNVADISSDELDEIKKLPFEWRE